MQDVTHLLFALSLAYVLDLPVVYAMIGGLLPDADIWIQAWFPVTHRGIMHTPLFAGVSAFTAFLVTNRRHVAAALGVGLLSHLYLDSITPMGVQWLYPVVTEMYSLDIVLAANPTANLVMSAFFIMVMVGWRYWTEVSAWFPR